MIAITRDGSTANVIVTAYGELNGEALATLVEVLTLTDDAAAIVIDLTDAGELTTTRTIGLLSALAFRSGTVAFRGAGRRHRWLLGAAQPA